MRKNALEWVVFALGLALIVALTGYLAQEAAGRRGAKAELRVTLGRPEKIEAGYRTEVRIENRGDEATMGVKVKVDDADLDLDYVPRHSTREGFVVTEKPPKEGRAVGWQAP